MPAKKQTGPQAESEYARASWDWAQEPLSEAGFDTQVSLHPTGRVGVWSVRVRLLHVVDGKPAGIVRQVQGEWPNVTHQSFWGCVWALQMRLAEHVQQDAEGLLRNPA